MNARNGTTSSPLMKALVALVALALALFALGMGAPAALADQPIDDPTIGEPSVEPAGEPAVEPAGDPVVKPKPTLKVTSYYGDYDGQPHSASVSIVGEAEGYYLVFTNAKGEVLSNNPSRTVVGTEEFMVYMYDSKGQTAYFTNFFISIDPRNVVVNITGNSQTFYYDGETHAAEGYTVDSIAVQEIQGLATPAYTEADFTILEGQEAKVLGDDAGTYPMNLFSIDFANLNSNFNVTFNVTDGALTIAQRPVDIRVEGNIKTTTYDGTQQVSEGWQITSVKVADVPNQLTPEFDQSTVNLLTLVAVATGTDVGVYPMNLAPEQFACSDGNFAPTFTVVDGGLKIDARKATVSITGNSMYTFYNGQQQSIGGYILDGIAVEEIEGLATPEYKGTDFDLVDPEYVPVATGVDAGMYPMGLSDESFVNNNTNFVVEFNVEDGFIGIDALPVLVRVEGNIDVVQYNGAEQVVEGFTVTSVNAMVPEDYDYGYLADAASEGEADGPALSEENGILPYFDVSSVKTLNLVCVAKGTNVGVYPMGLVTEEFYCDDENFVCEFKVVDGGLRIEAREGVVLTVTGNTAAYDYDGKAKTVEGYTFSSNDPIFTEADWYFDGTASVTATNPGTYAMGLAADQFSVASKNFANVKFVVTDGQLVITGESIPKTGDDTNAALPVAAAAAGVVAICAGVALVRRQQRS